MENLINLPFTAKKSHRLGFIVLAFALAIVLELVFWGKKPGLGLALFNLVYAIGFLGVAHFSKHLKNKWALLLLIPVGIVSLDFLLLNNKFLQLAGPIFTFILLFCFSVLVTLKNPEGRTFDLMKIPIVKNVFLTFTRYSDIFKDLIPDNSKKESEILKKVMVGIAISLPILIVFGALFVNADAVFSELVVDTFDFEVNGDNVGRVIRAILIGFVISGFFYVLLSKEHSLAERMKSVFRVDTIIASIVLASVNLLFAVFVFIQIKYLFGGSDFIIDNSITFAEYARSGFFELVWVMIFAALLIGFVYRSFSHHKNSSLITSLQVLLIVQVGVIAVSALTRMNLYQDAYGYTVLRLYVEWFIYFVLLLLLLGIGSIVARMKFEKYFYVMLVAGLLALTTIFSLNVDYIIAKQNVQRFLDGRELDANYLQDLSIDVVPAVLVLEDERLGQKDKIRIRNLLESKRKGAAYRSIWEFNFGAKKVTEMLEK